MTGVPKDSLNVTCTSGAGSLLLEFGLLSRLLGDPVYETVARRAVDHLWNHRNNVTGLFGRYFCQGWWSIYLLLHRCQHQRMEKQDKADVEAKKHTKQCTLKLYVVSLSWPECVICIAVHREDATRI